jgi:predicted DNA-binding WGR domain protein
MTTPYPMVVKKLHLNHQGGTKFYAMTLVATSTDKCIFIRRWGKVKAFGEILVQKFHGVGAATKEFDTFLRGRERRGYRIEASEANPAEDQEQLIRQVGRATWAKLPPDALTHLDSTISTAGVREAEPPRYDEDGNFVGNPPPRKYELSEEEKAAVLAEQRAKEEALQAKRRAANPNFGRF